jgi:hypothetical protein
MNRSPPNPQSSPSRLQVSQPHKSTSTVMRWLKRTPLFRPRAPWLFSQLPMNINCSSQCFDQKNTNSEQNPRISLHYSPNRKPCLLPTVMSETSQSSRSTRPQTHSSAKTTPANPNARPSIARQPPTVARVGRLSVPNDPLTLQTIDCTGWSLSLCLMRDVRCVVDHHVVVLDPNTG